MYAYEGLRRNASSCFANWLLIRRSPADAQSLPEPTEPAAPRITHHTRHSILSPSLQQHATVACIYLLALIGSVGGYYAGKVLCQSYSANASDIPGLLPLCGNASAAVPNAYASFNQNTSGVAMNDAGGSGSGSSVVAMGGSVSRCFQRSQKVRVCTWLSEAQACKPCEPGEEEHSPLVGHTYVSADHVHMLTILLNVPILIIQYQCFNRGISECIVYAWCIMMSSNAARYILNTCPT